jgi:hypothetical protein
MLSSLQFKCCKNISQLDKLRKGVDKMLSSEGGIFFVFELNFRFNNFTSLTIWLYNVLLTKSELLRLISVTILHEEIKFLSKFPGYTSMPTYSAIGLLQRLALAGRPAFILLDLRSNSVSLIYFVLVEETFTKLCKSFLVMFSVYSVADNSKIQ